VCVCVCHSQTNNLQSDQFCINAQDVHGDTPLHVAVRCGQTAIVKTLLSIESCDVNIPNMDGHTPLLLAINAKHDDCAMLLISHCGEECK
jgi:ankyrin repeat protein